MRIRDILAEAIATVCLFAVGYGLLLIAHGAGW
jgi:hypothetical protein